MIRHAANAEVSGLSIALPLALLIALSGAVAVKSGVVSLSKPTIRIEAPEALSIAPHEFEYREATEYYRKGLAVDAPKRRFAVATPLVIMKFQTTLSEYNRCVTEAACDPAEGRSSSSSEDTPVTGVSYDDAVRYAAWLSERTGNRWRLPSDFELAYAAGDRFPDDALGIDVNDKNPATRWLADYEREARRAAATDPRPQPKGSFGISDTGLVDFAGNVWEWTSSCNKRIDLDKGEADIPSDPATCGILIAAGKHRAPMSSFVRNPKGGGCSVGSPPDNLGFRLVRSPTFAEQISNFVQWGMGPFLTPLKYAGYNRGPPDES